MIWKHVLTQPLAARFGGFVLAATIRAWMQTLDYQTVYYDERVDPARHDLSRERHIYIFWHEYIPYQLYLRGNCNICMMLSDNRDAHLLSRAAYHLGFGTVRGSTYSGPRRALRGMMRAGRIMHLTLTPDGPRGPRRVLSAGAIYLASRLQAPLVAIGMGYDRPWRLSSWDRFAVPRPYSRARCVVSPPLHIPSGVRGVETEAYRQRVENLLNQLTSEAEAWAAAGTPKIRQQPTRRSPRRLPQPLREAA
jgi:hypothetical protein